MSTFLGQGDWPYYPRRTSDGPAFVPVLTPVPKARTCGDGCNGCEECTDYDDSTEDDSPYCRCDNLPTMGEVYRNRCAACGRPLK
jgi:hypothetical protein